MQQLLKRTWAEIDLDALRHNFKVLQQIGENTAGVIGVVKADAYGHGAIQVGKLLEELGAAYLAVSSLDEARELRQNGIAMPILILGYTPPEYVPQLLENDITQTIGSEESAVAYSQVASACGGTLRVHIKVDTGMSRLGFLCVEPHFNDGLGAITRIFTLPNLDPEGIFTHFAVSDEPEDSSNSYTCQQYDLFVRVIAELKELGHTLRLCHCVNSGATAYHPEMKMDLIRAGILLYGCGAGSKELGLQPVMSLKTTVSSIKNYDIGTDVSYGRSFTTKQATRMGVLPIGYADGFLRALSNNCALIANGSRAQQCGRICMDMSMIDLTDLPAVQVGDEIEVFGKQQRVDDLALLAGTISYELTCAVSKRVPRVFLQGGTAVGVDLRLHLCSEQMS